MQRESSDLEVLKQGKPYLRSILAFIIYIRYGGLFANVATSYLKSDEFIKRLEQDVEASPSA